MALYTLVYNMTDATKTIRVSEDLLTRIKAHSREGETLNETLNRLIRGPSLHELAGMLSDEEAATFRAAIKDSHESHGEEVEEMFKDME